MNSYMKEIEDFLPSTKSLNEKLGAEGCIFDELQPADSSAAYGHSEDHRFKIRTRNQLLSDERKRSLDPTAEIPPNDSDYEPKFMSRKHWTIEEDEILFTHAPSLVDNNEWDKLLDLLPGRTIGAMRKRYQDARKVKSEIIAAEVGQKERPAKRRRGSSVAKFDSIDAADDEEVAESEAIAFLSRQIKRPAFQSRIQETCMVVDKPAVGMTVSTSTDTFPDEQQVYGEYMRSTFACVSTDTRESSFSIQRGSIDEAEDEVLPFAADVLVEDVLEDGDAIEAQHHDRKKFEVSGSIPALTIPPAASAWHEDEAFVRSVLDCLSSDAPPLTPHSSQQHHAPAPDLFPDDGDHTIDDLGSSICDFGHDIDDDLFWHESSTIAAFLPAPVKSYYDFANTMRGQQQQQQAVPEEYWSNATRRYETRSATQLRREVENMAPNYNYHMPPKVVYVPCYYMKSGSFTSMYVANHHSFTGLSRPPPGYHLIHVPAIISTGQAMQVASYPDFPLKFVR